MESQTKTVNNYRIKANLMNRGKYSKTELGYSLLETVIQPSNPESLPILFVLKNLPLLKWGQSFDVIM